MMTNHGSRVLVLGLDGGTFDLLDPLARSGVIPFLAARMSSGMRAPLESVFPPKTIPAWYSFATGQDPGSLGIFGFTEPNGGPGKSQLVQTFRPAEAVWDRLSRQGHTVGVLGFPIRSGYPINGFIIPGMLGDAPPAYPADLRATVEKALGEPWVPELPAYRESERASWMALAEAGVRQRSAASEVLIQQYRPDFLFVLFRETDRIEHQHWTDLSRPIHQWPADLVSFWRAVDRACARIDSSFRSVGEPAVTMVVSDHGHGPAKSDFFTNRWLHDHRYLVFRNGGEGTRRRWLARALLLLDRFPPTRGLVAALADRVRGGGPTEQFGRWLGGDASFEAMAQRIDWERTVAFSYPVPEGIYLNWRNPSLTPERARGVVDRIRSELSEEGCARIEAYEPREIYDGERLDRAPALLLKIDEFATEPRMDFSYPEAFLPGRPGFFYGSGVHRMQGVLIASGPGVRRGGSGRPFRLLDVAPTVLELMGVSVPAGMKGQPFGRDLLGSLPN
jgi:predicted AlkP superfamily phosphohydrolase/phosphomutase